MDVLVVGRQLQVDRTFHRYLKNTRESDHSMYLHLYNLSEVFFIHNSGASYHSAGGHDHMYTAGSCDGST